MAERQLALLLQMLDLIDRYRRTVTRLDLETDLETWLKVRGALEIAAQCAIDLALAIVSLRGLGLPGSYRDAFLALARAGVLDGESAAGLAGWAGLRNLLVHVYTTLDLDRIHAALFETEVLRRFHAIAARELAG